MNLLNEAGDSKFITTNWNITNDQWNTSYSTGNEIIYRKKALECNICDYNAIYNIIRRDITIIGCNGATQVSLKIAHHVLSVSQKLIEQQYMMLKI